MPSGNCHFGKIGTILIQAEVEFVGVASTLGRTVGESLEATPAFASSRVFR